MTAVRETSRRVRDRSRQGAGRPRQAGPRTPRTGRSRRGDREAPRTRCTAGHENRATAPTVAPSSRRATTHRRPQNHRQSDRHPGETRVACPRGDSVTTALATISRTARAPWLRARPATHPQARTLRIATPVTNATPPSTASAMPTMRKRTARFNRRDVDACCAAIRSRIRSGPLARRACSGLVACPATVPASLGAPTRSTTPTARATPPTSNKMVSIATGASICLEARGNGC